MLKYFNKKLKKGQSTLEYAILIIIIIGALLSIQVYIKRGIQGRLKSAADDIGEQFDPGNTNVIKVVSSSGRTTESFMAGVTNSVMQRDEITETVENTTIMNSEWTNWGG